MLIEEKGRSMYPSLCWYVCIMYECMYVIFNIDIDIPSNKQENMILCSTGLKMKTILDQSYQQGNPQLGLLGQDQNKRV